MQPNDRPSAAPSHPIDQPTDLSVHPLASTSTPPPLHIHGVELRSVNLWTLLETASVKQAHSFAYDCAIRALQEEKAQDRPPPVLAWQLLERKRMWINGSLELQTYDNERLVVTELLRQHRRLALKEKHPYGFAAWAHLGSLETLAAALGISHQSGIHTSTAAVKAAAARANTRSNAHPSSIAVEQEILWQKAFFLSQEAALQQARQCLLQALCKCPSQGILQAWKIQLEAQLFD